MKHRPLPSTDIQIYRQKSCIISHWILGNVDGMNEWMGKALVIWLWPGLISKRDRSKHVCFTIYRKKPRDLGGRLKFHLVSSICKSFYTKLWRHKDEQNVVLDLRKLSLSPCYAKGGPAASLLINNAESWLGPGLLNQNLHLDERTTVGFTTRHMLL